MQRISRKMCKFSNASFILYSTTSCLPVHPFTCFSVTTATTSFNYIVSFLKQTSKQKVFRHSLLYELQLPNSKGCNKTNKPTTAGASWRQQQWHQVLTQALSDHTHLGSAGGDGGVDACVDLDCAVDVGGSALSPTTFASRPLPLQLGANLQLKSKSKDNYNFVRAYELEEQTKLHQQHESKMKSLLPEASISSYDYYYSNDSLRSSDCGSDNLVVTFDYGFSDSLLEEISGNDFSVEKKMQADLRTVFPIKEEIEYAPNVEETNVWWRKPESANSLKKYDDDDYSDSWEQQEEEGEAERIAPDDHEAQIWFNTALTRSQNECCAGAAFKVHHMQHALLVGDNEEMELEDEEVREESLDSSLEVEDRKNVSQRSASTSSASSFYYRHLALEQWGRATETETAVDVAPNVAEMKTNEEGDAGSGEEEFFDSLNLAL